MISNRATQQACRVPRLTIRSLPGEFRFRSSPIHIGITFRTSHRNETPWALTRISESLAPFTHAVAQTTRHRGISMTRFPSRQILLALLLSGGCLLQAQINTASLSGLATDPSGAALPHATVVAKDDATGYTRTVQTDDAGAYSLQD